MFTLIGRYKFDRSLFETFSLLLISQGFSGSESIETFTKAWNQITSVPPFSDVLALDPSKTTMSVYCENLAGDLGLQHNGSELVIPEAKKYKLRDYLAHTKVPPTLSTVKIDAINVWPEQGRVGRVGSLVAVLVKGDTPGELYQITSSPRYPIPLVAVVVTGDNWGKVIVRGVAQTFALLADEYELPDPEYLRAPDTLIELRPNVMTISDGQRVLLKSGYKAQNLIGFPWSWGLNTNTDVKFHEHSGTAPDLSTSKKGNGRVQLVEGAAGYRLNAFRCDFDCLMRRKPNSKDLPIQISGVEFCRACWGALHQAVNNWDSYDLARRPRILLDSQLPLCDMVRWKTLIPVILQVPFDLPAAGTQPEWSCRVEPDKTRGLILRNVKLKNRPKDPFKAAEDTFKSIEFGNLAVKFEGEAARSLPIADAYANKSAPPLLQVMTDSVGSDLVSAVRLSLTWHFPDRYAIEAVMSVVFKDKAHDFDPGGVALANKLYPQLSMRYRRPPKSVKGKLPKVEWLKGSIKLVANNIFPINMDLHEDLKHFANGTLQTTLFTESNASDDDNEYDWDEEDLAEFVAQFPDVPVPEWGLWAAGWEKGRKLAGLAPRKINPSPGATARYGHLKRGIPGLPHWSWLFDYATPIVASSKRFVAVYRKGEMTGKNHDGGLTRETQFKWPTASDQGGSPQNYEMTVRKLGRQGAYDNVHIHPSMSKHSGGEIIPVPFCCELCMHFHWRWGTVALAGAIDLPLFLGWGNGRLEQGAHTSPGAPLVPPNQHVEVVVDATGDHSVTYEVTAHDPDFDAYQVFLEQGISILYAYDGITDRNLSLLVAGVEVINPRSVNSKYRELSDTRVKDLAEYDRMVRNLFHEIYDEIRWYHQERDDISLKAMVQQIPDVTGAPSDLEEL